MPKYLTQQDLLTLQKSPREILGWGFTLLFFV